VIFIQKLGEVSLIAGEAYHTKNEKKTCISAYKNDKKTSFSVEYFKNTVEIQIYTVHI
jgi:alpha-acetolactate decarboxylase